MTQLYKHIVRIPSLALLGFLLALIPHTLFADEATFSATVSKNRLVVGEQFQLSFSINTNASNFNAPDLNDFIVYSGPNQSSSMQIMNGSMSQTISISYVLAPKREGKLNIGSATIQVAGKLLRTKAIQIEVGKGNSQAQQGNPNANKNANANNGAYPEDVESNIFMRASVSKSKVYQGEQLLVTFKVYTRLNIVDNALTKAPSFNGFWSEEVPNPTRQSELHSEVMDGIQYQVAEIKRTILIPQRSGTLTIDPLEMEIVTRVKAKSKNNSFFDQFFGGGYQDVKLGIASKTIKVEVMPLPEKGKPEGFSGAVGQLSLEAAIKNNELKTDEACNLTYTINGKGNLKLLEPFKLNLPLDVETYDPKIADKITVSTDGVKGSRSFEYLLIPRVSGEYTIPALPFSYFDPQKGQYVTVPCPEFSLKVQKGVNGDGVSVSREANKQDVRQIGNDIRYIKTNIPVFSKKENALFGGGMFYIICLIPIILYVLFLIWFNRFKKQTADQAGSRKRKASSIAQKQLKQAAVFLQSDNYNAFFDEVFKALYGYLSNTLNLQAAQLNKEKIQQELKLKNAGDENIAKLMQVLESCEFARYAPVKNHQAMENTYQQAADIIAVLESKLKK